MNHHPHDQPPTDPRPKRRPGRRTLAALTVAACTLIAAPNVPNAGASADGSTWEGVAYALADGTGIHDPVDQGPGVSYADLVSGADTGAGDLPSVYLDADGTDLFFRLRIRTDPVGRRGVASTAYVIQIGVDGQVVAAVGLDGKSPSTDYVYVTDPSGSTVTVIDETPFDTDVMTTRPDGAGAFFVDLSIPLAEVAAIAPEVLEGPVTLFFGTSQAANLAVINKDYMVGSSSDLDLGALVDLTGRTGPVLAAPEPTPTTEPAPDPSPTTTSTTEAEPTPDPTTTSTSEAEPTPDPTTTTLAPEAETTATPTEPSEATAPSTTSTTTDPEPTQDPAPPAETAAPAAGDEGDALDVGPQPTTSEAIDLDLPGATPDAAVEPVSELRGAPGPSRAAEPSSEQTPTRSARPAPVSTGSNANAQLVVDATGTAPLPAPRDGWSTLTGTTTAPAGSIVELVVDQSTVRTVVDRAGRWTARIPAPSDGGEVQVSASVSTPDGAVLATTVFGMVFERPTDALAASRPTAITAPAEQLAHTGTDPLTTAAMGAGILIAGIALHRTGDRRRS